MLIDDLSEAIREGLTEKIIRMLNKHPELVNQPSKYDYAPLYTAILRNQRRIVPLLYEHHADPSLPGERLDKELGDSFLRFIIFGRNLSLIRLTFLFETEDGKFMAHCEEELPKLLSRDVEMRKTMESMSRKAHRWRKAEEQAQNFCAEGAFLKANRAYAKCTHLFYKLSLVEEDKVFKAYYLNKYLQYCEKQFDCYERSYDSLEKAKKVSYLKSYLELSSNAIEKSLPLENRELTARLKERHVNVLCRCFQARELFHADECQHFRMQALGLYQALATTASSNEDEYRFLSKAAQMLHQVFIERTEDNSIQRELLTLYERLIALSPNEEHALRYTQLRASITSTGKEESSKTPTRSVIARINVHTERVRREVSDDDKTTDPFASETTELEPLLSKPSSA